MLTPTDTSDHVAVGAVAAQFSITMAQGHRYRVCSSTACYVAVGTNPTASAADGSHYLPANEPLVVSGAGWKVSIVRVSADGIATMSPLGPNL